jgi:hypothetical protein
MKSALVMLCACLLAACTYDDNNRPTPQDSVVVSDLADLGLPRNARPETVYAVSAGKDGMKFRVPSNGCTTKDYIKPVVWPTLPGAPPMNEIFVFRIKPDTCQSFVMGSAWVEFSYAEMGVNDTNMIALGTRLTPWTGPGE